MKYAERLAVSALILLYMVAAAACSGVSYSDDYDPSVDFSAFKTYAWVPDSARQGSGTAHLDELSERRIKSAIEQQLSAKGMSPAGSGTPDFLVHFYVTTQQKMDVNTYYTGWGYYGWYGGGTQTYVNEWTEGSLIVDFIEFKEKDLAWRGWAKAALEDNLSAEQRTQRVNEVVAGILNQFPPQK